MDLYQGTVRLGVGHGLIVGHGPRLTELKLLEADALSRRLESFGFFDVGTPDTATYYKDVTAEDLMPKESDYVRPIFRALSEVVVRKTYDPIDFGHEKGVLQSSAPLLVAQSIFTNHEAMVGNEVGVVSKTFWDRGYTVGGISIPAGINFEALIDGKNHPRLARNLLSDPPVVHSNSVTVQFKWSQSHPQMSYDEFRGKVGNFDDKGQLIRRIVTKIDSYNETSFVTHGADPFAQKVGKDGKIVNPTYAHNRDSFSESFLIKKGRTNYYFSDFKTSITSNSEEEDTSLDNDNISEQEDTSIENQTQNCKMNKESVLLMAILAGITLSAEDTALSDAEFATKFDFAAFNTKLLAEKTKLTALSIDAAKVAGLEAKIQTLETFKTTNEPKLAQLTLVEAQKSKQLAELMRVSALVNGKAVDGTLKDTYEAADLTTLEAFLTPLQAQLESKFPLTCKKCNSTEVARNSAAHGGHDDDSDTTAPLTADQLRDKAKASYKANRNKGFLTV